MTQLKKLIVRQPTIHEIKIYADDLYFVVCHHPGDLGDHPCDLGDLLAAVERTAFLAEVDRAHTHVLRGQEPAKMTVKTFLVTQENFLISHITDN